MAFQKGDEINVLGNYDIRLFPRGKEDLIVLCAEKSNFTNGPRRNSKFIAEPSGYGGR